MLVQKEWPFWRHYLELQVAIEQIEQDFLVYKLSGEYNRRINNRFAKT